MFMTKTMVNLLHPLLVFQGARDEEGIGMRGDGRREIGGETQETGE